MKNFMKYVVMLFVSLTITSCVTEKKSETTSTAIVEKQEPVKNIMNAEEQGKMTPDEIIESLKKGNENFVNNNLTPRDHSSQRIAGLMGQYPKAIVLSCVDSRVPVEDVFDLGIGDVFVARVAGNVESIGIVGSMEFATAVAGSKIVIVMGHSSCGAVKHAIDNTDAASMDMSSLQSLLDEIKPAVASTETNGDVSSKNKEFTSNVIYNNAKKTVEDIRIASPKMASLEKEGKIKIVAAVYNMAIGKVEFI